MDNGNLILNLTLGKEDICREIVEERKNNNVEVDWENLADLVIYHGVASLIHKNVENSGYDFLPDSFRSEIESFYYAIAGKNTRFFAEMKKMLISLNDSGVDTIVLKGAALGETLYKNIALRPIEDIDLLVKRFDFPTAKAAFRKWGYNMREKIFPSKMHQIIANERHKPFEKYESELHFFDMQNRFFFDVHWNLLIVCDSGIADAIQMDTTGLWERAKYADLGNIGAYVMSFEDMLIYLCLHLRERHFEKARSRLIWWYDIYLILKNCMDDFDTAYFLETVVRYGAQKSVFEVLNTASQLLKTPLSGEIEKAIGGNTKCFTLEEVIPEPSEQIKYRKVFKDKDYLTDLREIKGFTKKMRILAGDIFPDSRYMVSYYGIENKALLPFYYMVRFKNVLSKGIKAASQAFKNE